LLVYHPLRGRLLPLPFERTLDKWTLFKPNDRTGIGRNTWRGNLHQRRILSREETIFSRYWNGTAVLGTTKYFRNTASQHAIGLGAGNRVLAPHWLKHSYRLNDYRPLYIIQMCSLKTFWNEKPVALGLRGRYKNRRTVIISTPDWRVAGDLGTWMNRAHFLEAAGWSLSLGGCLDSVVRCVRHGLSNYYPVGRTPSTIQAWISKRCPIIGPSVFAVVHPCVVHFSTGSILGRDKAPHLANYEAGTLVQPQTSGFLE